MEKNAGILPMAIFSETTPMKESELEEEKVFRSYHEEINSHPSLLWFRV